jgi:hypothetical protein
MNLPDVILEEVDDQEESSSKEEVFVDLAVGSRQMAGRLLFG